MLGNISFIFNDLLAYVHCRPSQSQTGLSMNLHNAHTSLCLAVFPFHFLLLLPLSDHIGCCHTEGKNYGYQPLDNSAAPIPPNVVKQRAGKTCSKKAADGEGRRPERGDKRIGLDVFRESRRLQGLVQCARVGRSQN